MQITEQCFKIIMLILIIHSICLAQMFDSTHAIDTTIKKNISDIDFDNTNDTLVYRIQGTSWHHPLTLTFTVRSKQGVVFTKATSEVYIDEEFQTPDNMDFCQNKNAIQCKYLWYMKHLLKATIIGVSLGSERRSGLFDSLSEMSIPNTLCKYYIDSLQYSKKDSNAKVKSILKLLKGNDMTFFALPPHPIYKSFPSLYDPQSKKLIMIMGF